MIKNILIGVVVLVIATVAGLLLYFQTKIGDIEPLLPNSNTPTLSVQGKWVDFLTSTNNLKTTYFAAETPGARDLELTPAGNLVVSLTSQGKVVALPDKDNNGLADSMLTVIEGLKNPHGLAFKDGKLFIAEEDKVSRYSWDEETFKATFEKKLIDLPADGGHFTRSLLFTSDGQLLISVGSSCNVCLESSPYRAAVIVTDVDGNLPQVFAKGTRNSVFMANHPETGEVWATDMGRDLLGDNIPPEEINILSMGNDYGWPYCYGDKIHDDNFDPQKEHSCDQTTAPLYGFQAHSAPLGLAFWKGDLLVSYHGSWNRTTPTGYKVIKMNLDGNRVTGEEDFLTGFINNNSAQGRPVDILVKDDHIFISDDKAGAIYLLSGT